MPRAKFPKKFVGAAEIQWLREQIEVNHIPQASLAKAMGIDPSAVSRILSGGRRFKDTEYAQAGAYVEARTMGVSARLRRALARFPSRMTTEELAERAGLPPDRVADLLRGNGAALGDSEARALAEVLGMTADYFLFSEFVPASPVRPGMPAGSYVVMPDFLERGNSPVFNFGDQPQERDPRKVDVYAAPAPVGGGYFRRVEHLAERRNRPPALLDVENAYAMLIEGNELTPRYMDGEVIFVHPNRSAAVGKWTMVQVQSGLFCIGRLLERNGERLVLDVPQAGEVRIQLTEIRSQALIAGSWHE